MLHYQIGERIGGIRMNLNLSKAQFGQMTGLSGQYIGKIEKGEHGLTANTIAKICYATNISADYLLFGVKLPSQYIGTPVLENLSPEQIQILFDIIKKFAQFVNTEDGNEVLINEVASQQRINFARTRQKRKI